MNFDDDMLSCPIDRTAAKCVAWSERARGGIRGPSLRRHDPDQVRRVSAAPCRFGQGL